MEVHNLVVRTPDLYSLSSIGRSAKSRSSPPSLCFVREALGSHHFVADGLALDHAVFLLLRQDVAHPLAKVSVSFLTEVGVTEDRQQGIAILRPSGFVKRVFEVQTTPKLKAPGS